MLIWRCAPIALIWLSIVSFCSILIWSCLAFAACNFNKFINSSISSFTVHLTLHASSIVVLIDVFVVGIVNVVDVVVSVRMDGVVPVNDGIRYIALWFHSEVLKKIIRTKTISLLIFTRSSSLVLHDCKISSTLKIKLKFHSLDLSRMSVFIYEVLAFLHNSSTNNLPFSR